MPRRILIWPASLASVRERSSRKTIGSAERKEDMPAISDPMQSAARREPRSGPALGPSGAARVLFNLVAWLKAMAGLLALAPFSPAPASTAGCAPPATLDPGARRTAGHG